MNFKSAIVVTYGRSGSTLLMGVLNSIEGVLIRGENDNFFYHLYCAYQSLIKTTSFAPKDSPTHPWYGCSAIDLESVLAQMSALGRSTILGDRAGDATIQCYGFKEIRYLSLLKADAIDGQKAFCDYLNFLSQIFPDCCFIFNCRDEAEVLNSLSVSFWNGKDQLNRKVDIHRRKVLLLQKLFHHFQRSHGDRCYQISYGDVMGKTEVLRGLFEFLGASYNESAIDGVLGVQHSYRPFQEAVQRLPKG